MLIGMFIGANVDQTTFIMHLSNHYYQIRDGVTWIDIQLIALRGCYSTSKSIKATQCRKIV